MKYICHFEFNGKIHKIEDPYGRGLCSFKDGFWVDRRMEWPLAIDTKWWIPPGKIQYIEKVEKL